MIPQNTATLSFGWLERKRKTYPFLPVRNRPSGRPTTTHKPRLQNRRLDPQRRTVENRPSDNICGVKKILSEGSPSTPKSAISLSLRFAIPTKAPNRFQVRNAVRPMHLLRSHPSITITISNSPLKGSGILNQLLDFHLHAIACSGLSRVRTELFQLPVIPPLAHHPLNPNRQSARHRDLGDLPSHSHRQVGILTSPFRVAAHRDLGRFHLSNGARQNAVPLPNRA